MDIDQQQEYKKLFAHDPLLMGKALLPDTFNLPSPDFHKQIVHDYMDPKQRKYCYIAPRGHAKSTIVACLLVLHHLEYAPYRQKVIMLCSKTEGHAIALLDTLKNILDGSSEHGYYAQMYGVRNRKNSRKWGERMIVLPDRSVIMAKGTGQQVVGTKRDSQRPTLIVVDDPEDLSNTKTKEAMEVNQQWLFRQVDPALDPKGKMIVIGTPQNELCIVETLARMSGEWLCRRWSAIAGDGWEQNPAEGKALWPEWKNVQSLWAFYKDCEGIGRASYFYMEYQCVVTGDGDRKFYGNMFRYWQGELVNRGAYRCIHGHYYSNDGKKGQEFVIPVTVQVGIDLASSVGVRNDWTVMFPWCLTWNKSLYQLPYDRFRKHTMQAGDHIASRLLKLNPDYVFIESQNFQVMMRDYLREFHQLTYPGLSRKITYSENKEDRIFNKLQPYYAKHNVFHYYGKCEELEGELLMFPRSRFDDTADSASTGLFRVYWPEIGPGGLDKKGSTYADETTHEPETANSWMLS